MPQLLLKILAARGCMNDEPGAAGGGDPPAPAAAPAPAADPVVEPTAEMLDEEGLTAEEFAKLPPEEQKALMSETPDDETPAGEQAAATPPPPPAPAPPAPPAPPPAAPPVEAPAPAAPAAEAAREWRAAPATNDNPLGLPEVAMPAYPTPMVTQERVAERDTAQTKLDELEGKYEDGSITLAEYREQRTPLRKTVEEVNADIAADRGAMRTYQATAGEAFGTMVRASLDVAKDAGLDYRDPANLAKLQELDRRQVELAKAGPLVHPGKPAAWYDRWALTEAHKQLADKYGITLKPAAGAPAAGPSTAPAPRAAPDLRNLPPTTRGAPSAAAPSIAAGEFSHLDALQGVELEKAVAMLKGDALERYLDR